MATFVSAGIYRSRKMYNVSVGPSKIVAKTRRGINQNIERLDNNRDHGRKNGDQQPENVNGPRPVFNMSHRRNVNGRHQETVTAEHEELARFVASSWNDVWRDYEVNCQRNSTGPDTVVYYEELDSDKLLNDFKPFDFEAWWGRRLFNNITKSVP